MHTVKSGWPIVYIAQHFHLGLHCLQKCPVFFFFLGGGGEGDVGGGGGGCGGGSPLSDQSWTFFREFCPSTMGVFQRQLTIFAFYPNYSPILKYLKL